MHQYGKINRNCVDHKQEVCCKLSNINELHDYLVDNIHFSKNALHMIFFFCIHHHKQILICHYKLSLLLNHHIYTFIWLSINILEIPIHKLFLICVHREEFFLLENHNLKLDPHMIFLVLLINHLRRIFHMHNV